MKRKPTPKPDTPVVDAEILTKAKEILGPSAEVSPKKAAKCEVCGDPSAPNATEALCWVCRRLKISAWRDNDPQIAAQE